MKSFTLLVVAAAFAITTGEETCDYSVVKPTFHELGTPMAACENATGITFETGSELSLTRTEQSDVCSECTDMVDLVYSFTWYDCVMEIDGVNQTLSTYYETLVGDCSNSSSSAATATSTAGSGSSSATCDYALVKPDFHQIGTPMAACESSTGINFETGSALSLSSTEQSEICSECTDMVDLLYSFTCWVVHEHKQQHEYYHEWQRQRGGNYDFECGNRAGFDGCSDCLVHGFYVAHVSVLVHSWI
ncbi:hypothetical protein BBO99_00004930 [Phytophthora kernoviae]|uniref:Apple domain-containing protein n=2 Tax=Phytophthora kernoviae TaxID=325452 RepID=A0A421GQ24_9STRA|nr:hypothetical protein G195_006578 [Phytophthora kernoviae 00238/432]KAG2524167.1 hypothetical protein JM16_002619 [Phytophthora kernoviae]RLN26340.1 hypothetical protein BBI17_006145 [Phytophthora kernoviae]RLN79912.1 hypothetical protein BBO99_00004930 [Phytophthora kernoviae]